MTTRKLIITEDGSPTFFDDRVQETFHSDRGSWQESQHTFIAAGLQYWLSQNPEAQHLQVFEMGLGTGLNALLSWQEAEKRQIAISYTGLEAFPLIEEEYSQIDLSHNTDATWQQNLLLLHRCPPNQWVALSPHFTLYKNSQKLEDVVLEEAIDLCYFDAFSPRSQPELWQASIFAKLYTAMQYGGVLVSYSAAGVFKRSLQQTGFWLHEMRGARGKREMVRALKL